MVLNPATLLFTHKHTSELPQTPAHSVDVRSAFLCSVVGGQDGSSPPGSQTCAQSPQFPQAAAFRTTEKPAERLFHQTEAELELL